MSGYLQAFLIFDIFAAGIIASLAWRHAYAHFRPQRHELEKPQHQPTAANRSLPPALREQMLANAQSDFQKVLEHATGELQKDLAGTSIKINKLLDKLAAEVLSHELERYRIELDHLREQATTNITQAGSELQQHQADLKAKLEAEMAAEKQRRVEQLDGKLADAVSSFLLEALSHNIDLGAQSSYLNSQLEKHKSELARSLE